MVFLIISIVLIVILCSVVFIVLYLKNAKGQTDERKKYIPTTQDQVVVDYVREGIVKLKSGGYRYVLETNSINIELMEDSEIDLLTEVYVGILSSITYRLQFFLQSKIVDISEYMELLDIKKKNATSVNKKAFVNAHQNHVLGLVKRSAILTRKNYIIITWDEAREKSSDVVQSSEGTAFDKLLIKLKLKKEEINSEWSIKDEEKRFNRAQIALEQRGKQLIQSMRDIGIRSRNLNDQEATELYFTCYNKNRSTYQSMKNIQPSDYTSLYVKKKGGITNGKSRNGRS